MMPGYISNVYSLEQKNRGYANVLMVMVSGSVCLVTDVTATLHHVRTIANPRFIKLLSV